LNSNRLFGAAIVLGGVILMGMAIASTNATPEQLGDPFVGHFTKHTIRYFIIAAGAVFSGGIIATFGSLRSRPSAR
jgi:anaerobic glycerol-3-phosphate dehydrogenase